jgi:hypothetical protein
MRTIARTLINLAHLVGILAVLGAAITSDAYKQASHDTQVAVPVIIAVAGFVLARVALHFVPAKRKPSPRPSFTYAAPVKRGR